MAKSQNGWSAFLTYSASALVDFSWITGKVRRGNVHTVFDHFCKRFHNEVEPITKAHSWGFAPRKIIGSLLTISNHASGTALDLNAPKHPLGRRKTFTPSQEAALRKILDDYDDVIRWGGDYLVRPDEMHFEINESSAKVTALATKLKIGLPVRPASNTRIKVDSKWGRDTTGLAQKIAGTTQDRTISGQEIQHRNKHLTTGWEWSKTGQGKGSRLIASLQEDLQKMGHYKGKIDGIAGPAFWKAFRAAFNTKTIRGAIGRFQDCLNAGRLWPKK